MMHTSSFRNCAGFIRSAASLLLFAVALSAGGESLWRYDVTLSHPGQLDVEAWFPTRETVHAPAFEVLSEACANGTCHVRYRVHLDDEVTSPGEWLLHPPGTPDRVRVHLAAAEGLHAATGMTPAPDGAPSTYECRGFPDAVFSIFGSFELEVIEEGGARIDVAMTGAGTAVARERIREWVRRAARSVTAYYGRMPMKHVLLIVRVTRGARIGGGTTMGGGGGAVMINAGAETTRETFDGDWELTHEFVHLAFPDQERQHHWIEEGIATYVEPIARSQAGIYPATRIWRDLADGLPKGEPQTFDRGLDHTHTWGRTYWGGALFCFVADVEIRRRTSGRRGLQDALRGILNAGGTIDQEWDLTRALAAGDAATGTKVLEELYAEMKDDPHPIDLQTLFARLGVKADGTLTDEASESSLRRAIERGKKD
jgi:predicted metalloprotease with PDZ domain